MRQVLASGGDVTELVRASVLVEAFRRRSFEGVEP
jgi:hypothetical protein